ncbi:MAG TPA: RHS repeat-associated core domain-containing protein [Ktedonobacterales bacterium]
MSHRLTGVTTPDGTVVAFIYDADGQRNAKAVTSGGTTTTVNDLYQLGHLAEQTDGAGTMLASFSYDSQGVPTSVQVGSDPTTAPRYYYVYNGHGDVVALTDASGTSVATYGYDAWGAVTVDTEHFANGWRNPYLYDGRDGARYDAETGLYWLSVRAYDPTLGRFLSHDPLGRAPLFFADQPYVYAGNNPLLNVDPSGQRFVPDPEVGAPPAPTHRVASRAAPRPARVLAAQSRHAVGSHLQARACRAPHAHPTCTQIDNAKAAAHNAFEAFGVVFAALSTIGFVIQNIKDYLLVEVAWLLGIAKSQLKAVLAAGAGALTVVLVELTILAGMFWVQATQTSDGYWTDLSNIDRLEASVEAGTILGNIVLGLVALVAAVIVMERSPLAGMFLAGATAGAILCLFSLPFLVGAAFDSERKALGY